MPREDKTGTDWGYEPEVLTSRDGGALQPLHIGDEATRCIGNYCAAPYGLDIDGDDIYLSWRAKGSMWLAHLARPRRRLGGPTQLGPYLYAYHSSHAPYVDARGDTVVATWFSESDPDQMLRHGPVTAVLERPRPLLHAAHDRRRHGSAHVPGRRRLGAGPAGRRVRLVVVRRAPSTPATRTSTSCR